MDQFVTTYEKDYAWPSKKPIATVHDPAKPQDVQQKIGLCCCNLGTAGKKLRKEYVGSPTNESYEWSRLGPMGPLLDPKLYPAKTGPCPETEATRHDQPNAYLRKLEEKCPNLYGILKSAQTNEVVQHVNADRLKTTYQVDYSGLGARADEEHLQPCIPIKEDIEIDCRSRTRLPVRKRNRNNGDRDDKKQNGKKSRKVDDVDGAETRPPPWRTEYQDGISKMGQAIMKGKIHQKKKTMPMWSMST